MWWNVTRRCSKLAVKEGQLRAEPTCHLPAAGMWLTPGPLLPSILQALTEVSLFQRDRLAQQLVARRGYLHKLLEIFRVRLGCWLAAASSMPSATEARPDRPGGLSAGG